MIITACIFVYSSLVSVDPVSVDCVRGTERDLAEVTAMCRELDKDPLSMCEVQRVGAAKYIIRVRHMELSAPPAPPVYPAPVKKVEA